MHRISIITTILIASFVMALAGLVASPIATASENESVRMSARFTFGSPLLTDIHKSAIEKAVTTSGTDASFVVTAEAGKLPGVSDSKVQLLATKRGQVIKSYLVKLGVSKSSVTIKVKVTRLGIVPQTKIVGSYAAPVASTTTAVATTSTPAAPTLTCAEKIVASATCIVGDRGPGGGIVFYVSAANFTSVGSTCSPACKYLEVAPATWQDTTAPIYTTVLDDLTYVWSTDTTVATGQVLTSPPVPPQSSFTNEQENWKIGKGFNNTSLIRANSAAKDAVLAYAGNSTAGQWFIPAMNELNELCKYARGQTTVGLTVRCDSTGTLKTGTTNDLGGFVVSGYWSSSERDAGGAWLQSLANGVQGSFDKAGAGTFYVRPVRAF